jgi:Glycosyl hydrolase family 9
MTEQQSTQGGLLWFGAASQDNSLSPAINTAYLWSEYARLFPADKRTGKYRALADRQLDYVLGNNPQGNVYVVGQSPKSPKNPQVGVILAPALISGGGARRGGPLLIEGRPVERDGERRSRV